MKALYLYNQACLRCMSVLLVGVGRLPFDRLETILYFGWCE